MSCFGLRTPRGDLPLTTPPKPSTTLPLEDLSATNRRLVVIRRQPTPSPLRLDAGFKSRAGWQPLVSSRQNQDALALLLPLAEPLHHRSLFAVFDGHGRAAHRVSAFVAQRMSRAFAAALLTDDSVREEDALRAACARTQRALRTRRDLDVSMSGTTAAVAVVHGRRLVCANVGDSRIVLGTTVVGDGFASVLKATALTTDHVPTAAGERQRVEAAGGRVECWSPAGCDTGPPRVWLRERRVPGLSMSRAFGDSVLGGIVRPEPEIRAHALSEADRFLVVATDGVWNVMSNEEVVEFVGDRGDVQCQRVAEELVKHAARRWFDLGGESIDDISAIVVRFAW